MKAQEQGLRCSKESQDRIPRMEVLLEKENGLKGELLYSTVDQTGKWLEEIDQRAAYDEQGRTLEGGVLNRLSFRINQQKALEGGGALNYRIQLLASCQGGHDTEQQRQVTKLFEAIRPLLADQFVKRPQEAKLQSKDGKVIVLPELEGTSGSSAPVSLPSIRKSDFNDNSFK